MLSLLLSAAAAAAPTPTVLGEGLRPLAFVVGHCWRGEFAGGKQVDIHCYEDVYGGKHIRDRHEVTGGNQVYKGVTIYSWNAELGQVEYTYWNSLGGVSRGTMKPKDGILDFGDETHVSSDGKTIRIATSWRPSEASYDVISSVNGVTGGPVTTYKRVNASSAEAR